MKLIALLFLALASFVYAKSLRCRSCIGFVNRLKEAIEKDKHAHDIQYGHRLSSDGTYESKKVVPYAKSELKLIKHTVESCSTNVDQNYCRGLYSLKKEW